MSSPESAKTRQFEWPTLLVLLGCYALWAFGVFTLSNGPLAILLTGFAIAQHSSLQHEVIHGHPFKNQRLNAALIFPALTLFVPYFRFRDTHLAHHLDARLTDPYDDPESNYLDGGDWEAMGVFSRAIYRANNALLGRMILGPLISQMCFMKADWNAMRGGDRGVLAGWLWHIPATALVIWLVLQSQMPLWSYVLSAYLGLALLKIRTFLEHRAHEKTSARTVVIDDRGPLALLFLNNNFHLVHHMHPKEPWYRLPAVYHADEARYLERNEGYFYASYGQIFRRFFLKAKDQVPHPLWRR